MKRHSIPLQHTAPSHEAYWQYVLRPFEAHAAGMTATCCLLEQLWSKHAELCTKKLGVEAL